MLSMYPACFFHEDSGYFFFPLVNLIKQIRKGDNEYTCLNYVLICNIHCFALPSFVRRTTLNPLKDINRSIKKPKRYFPAPLWRIL